MTDIRLYRVEYRLERLDAEDVYAVDYRSSIDPELPAGGAHDFHNQYGNLIRSIPADVVESVTSYPTFAVTGPVGRFILWAQTLNGIRAVLMGVTVALILSGLFLVF